MNLVWQVGEADVACELFSDGRTIGNSARSRAGVSINGRRTGGAIRIGIVVWHTRKHVARSVGHRALSNGTEP